MNRRRFTLRSAICAASLGTPIWLHAAPRVARVAYVWVFSSGPSAPFPTAFRERLRDLGWIEGQNLDLQIDDAQGSQEKLAAIMQRHVAEKIDVIVGACTPEAKVAVKYTSTIPIVMAATGDPVAAGLVQSLAHPGGNVTGVSAMLLDLCAKRVQLLKGAFPNVARAAIIYNPERPDNHPEVRVMEEAAGALGVQIDKVQVRTPLELDTALDLMPSNVQALLNAGDTVVSSQRARLVAEAAKRRIPALYENREYVDVGGLMSYGPNFPKLHRLAAEYVDKILRGARAADLPIEQPESFELVINQRTAKASGFVLPPSLLLRADEVIS
jgi:putative ABC transport system substrate-binding protein